ncbi:MAG: adenylate kinase [Lachnospiraceae bacterium]|nr:adenylate kinase [Lachnospiraceae bacterium]
MQKVMVIGCPGSGKSTFARALHDITGLPLYHLDILYWNADRTIVSQDVFRARLADIIEKDNWIIDGNYGSTMELRMQSCDTVFFLDYPLDVCMKGITERRGKERPDMPWVEPEDDVDEEFIEFVKNYNSENRPAVLAFLEKYADREIFIFKSRNEADDFLKELRDEGH